MQIEHLREFLVFSKTLSITKAAEELFVTQSTLSKHIHALEQEIDAQLVITEGKQMHLTPAGAHLASKAQKIVRDCDTATERCRELSREETLVIKAQSIPFQQDAASLKYVEFIQGIAAAHQRVSVKYSQSSRREFEKSIASGFLDVALVYRYGNPDDIANAYREQGFLVKLIGTDNLTLWCPEVFFPDTLNAPVPEIADVPVRVPPNMSAPTYSILKDIETLYGVKATRHVTSADSPLEFINSLNDVSAYLAASSSMSGRIISAHPGMHPVHLESPDYTLCVFAIALESPNDIGKREVLTQAFA